MDFRSLKGNPGRPLPCFQPENLPASIFPFWSDEKEREWDICRRLHRALLLTCRECQPYFLPCILLLLSLPSGQKTLNEKFVSDKKERMNLFFLDLFFHLTNASLNNKLSESFTLHKKKRAHICVRISGCILCLLETLETKDLRKVSPKHQGREGFLAWVSAWLARRPISIPVLFNFPASNFWSVKLNPLSHLTGRWAIKGRS